MPKQRISWVDWVDFSVWVIRVNWHEEILSGAKSAKPREREYKRRYFLLIINKNWVIKIMRNITHARRARREEKRTALCTANYRMLLVIKNYALSRVTSTRSRRARSTMIPWNSFSLNTRFPRYAWNAHAKSRFGSSHDRIVYGFKVAQVKCWNANGPAYII